MPDSEADSSPETALCCTLKGETLDPLTKEWPLSLQVVFYPGEEVGIGRHRYTLGRPKLNMFI